MLHTSNTGQGQTLTPKRTEDSQPLSKKEEGIDLDLSGIGNFLKATREKLGITPKDLADSLRIGEEQLLAIELGEEDLLPEKVFIKAMIKRIAEKLKVNEDPIILGINPIKNAIVLENDKKGKEKNEALIPLKKLSIVFSISLISLFAIIKTIGPLISTINNRGQNQSAKTLFSLEDFPIESSLSNANIAIHEQILNASNQNIRESFFYFKRIINIKKDRLPLMQKNKYFPIYNTKEIFTFKDQEKGPTSNITKSFLMKYRI